MSRPQTVRGVAELRKLLRPSNGSVGFIPTMGALHAGHAALLAAARRQNETVVASIFVNPLQFDRKDDLDRYPRTLEQDLDLCEREGVDLVFAPGAEDLYPGEQLAFVEVPALEKHLCGAFRSGHFRGVATVVLKLLNIVAPERAYFGEKDGQQLAVIRRMAADLNLSTEIVAVPTVRECDGLALSSRNKLLTPEQRAIAPALYHALCAVIDELYAGERSTPNLRAHGLDHLRQVRVEYFELVDPETLVSLNAVGESLMAAGAIWLGTTRLIDNIVWRRGAPR